MKRRLLAGLITAAAFAGAPAWATHVEPQLLEGNISSCAQAGSTGLGISTNTAPVDGQAYAIGNGTITFTYNPPGQDKLIDWAATIPIDLVVIKGGPNANGYFYVPPAMADSGLHAPNNDSGSPAGVSHAVACYTPRLTISKTADTSFTRTWEWDIEKSVTPGTSDIFTGDSQTFAYSVEVDRTGYTDSDFRVFGSITIENDTPVDATITSVTDSIGGAPADVDCGVTFPYVLGDGQTLVCSYDEAVGSGASGTNVATVATSGMVLGGEATADYAFTDPTTVVNATINVEDSNGMSWEFGDDGTVDYPVNRTCDADEGTHANTATIVETGASDSASATLNCHALDVEKTVDGAFDRRWSWTIDKSESEDDPLLLMPGQTYQVDYAIELTPVGADEGWSASGSITIDNPNPVLAASLTGVIDVLSPDIAAVVDCPALSVPAGGTLVCTYTADLPDAEDRSNTATATLQNHDYAADGTPTPTGTTDFDDTKPLVFDDGDLAEEIDECVDVSDHFVIAEFLVDDTTALGEVCQDGNLSLQFSGTIEVPEEHCGPFDVDNTAAFVTNDTATEGDDSVTIAVDVACEPGCTLTQGYWKTHSAYGPAPYDETWALVLPNQEDTPFFLALGSDGLPLSWYETLWTPPQGNAYFVLAHQWIAATLNGLNGASAGAQVQEALADAEWLFGNYTVAQIAVLKGNKQPRPQFIALAGVLGMYNEGIGDLGPEHCSEDDTSID